MNIFNHPVIKSSKVITANFSGGRTSAKFCIWLKIIFGDRVKFIFMDTGAEHPDTYVFIKMVNYYFDLNITCIRGVFDTPIKTANNYEIIDVEDLRFDLKAFFGMLKKYGTPSSATGWCTSRMKDEIHDMYCNEVYGKGNYCTLLGIRYDEPARMVGNPKKLEDSAYRQLRNAGYDGDEISDLWREASFNPEKIPSLEIPDSVKELFTKRTEKLLASKIAYMGEFLDDEKSDVIDYWAAQDFDLEIDEHLGNCVFCIKKSVNKIALALRDEPDLANYMIKMICSPEVNVREKDKRYDRLVKHGLIAGLSEQQGRKEASKIMYRGHNTLESIIESTSHMTREEIFLTIRSMRRQESGGCSESCEPMTGRVDNE